MLSWRLKLCLQDYQRFSCGVSLISWPCGHFDRFCPRACAICHADSATLQPLCQPAKSLFPMTERDVEGDSEDILFTLIKLNLSPKAFSETAKHFYNAVALPVCTTPDGRLYSVLKCQKQTAQQTEQHMMTD